MRYLPSLRVGNTQLIKGKKRRGFLNHSQKKKKNKTKQKKNKRKKKKTLNLLLNTVTHREEEIGSSRSKGSQPFRDRDAERLGPGSMGARTERPERLRLKDIL